MCQTSNLPSTSWPLDSIACILTPLTPDTSVSRIPFKSDYSVVVYHAPAFHRVSLACFAWGGLKGQIALGDAHPYLALFDWENLFIIQTSPTITVGDLVFDSAFRLIQRDAELLDAHARCRLLSNAYQSALV